jgi:acetylornithine/succinyldiaminopimelate/putrescine aminotransferase
MNPSATTRELYDRYVIPTYGRFDLRLARGKGCEVWDESGKRYLDFGAGIAVTSIGHCPPARRHQDAAADWYAGSHVQSYFTRPQGELAERLVRLTCAPGEPRGKVFFCNSGAEANEALYKLARKFGNEVAPPPQKHTVGEWIPACAPRYEVITMLGSFHGRTLAGITATGQDKVKKGFDPLVPGFRHVAFNDEAALASAATEPRTAAILLEPIQGEIGVNPRRPRFCASRGSFAMTGTCC